MKVNFAELRKKPVLTGKGPGKGNGDGKYFISWKSIGLKNMVVGQWTGEVVPFRGSGDNAEPKFLVFSDVIFERPPEIEGQSLRYFQEAVFFCLSVNFDYDRLERGETYSIQWLGKKKSKNLASDGSARTYNVHEVRKV